MATARSRSSFRLVLVKPSHYDDDGYVIQWWRSWIPSNSLAALYGLARDCASRRVLGSDIDIEIEAYDETNTRIRIDDIIQRVKAASGGMVMLVGVQSNQMPRALDIAEQFRASDVQVAIGGFHVSGTIAMLPERDPDVRRAASLGVSLFAGEAEGRLDRVLQDAMGGTLSPLYDYMKELPSVSGAPIPVLPSAQIRRTVGWMTSFDAGRGCPYQCSFCTIINVQGRRSRRRSADDVEKIIRENDAAGVHQYFITDDNFARNKDWEPIFDRLIALREREGFRISATIQVDTLCHKIPRFIEKAARAGVRRVFIGLENINPESLMGAKKRQNKITEYRSMLLAWKAQRVITYAGYILGFPGDTKATILRDLDIIKSELPVDILEFFFLTPLPGSEDHKVLWAKGAPMDSDMNRYDLNHTCAEHSRMSRKDWEEAYREAWRRYYSDSHMKTVQMRAASVGIPPTKLLVYQVWFKGSISIEGVHPLEVGYLRLKSRLLRRPGLPIENAFVFYPKLALETLVKQCRWAWLWGKHGAVALVVRSRRRELRRSYRDRAMVAVTEEDAGTLSLFKSDAARGFVAHQQKVAAIVSAAAGGA